MRSAISSMVLSINTAKHYRPTLMIQRSTSIDRGYFSRWAVSIRLRKIQVKECLFIDRVWTPSDDLDSALNLIGHAQQQPSLLSYYVCLQKAEVLYADGEFELGENWSISVDSTCRCRVLRIALMYFHRANKVKPSQQICLEGIRKATEILECTICNPNIHLTITSNSAPIRADPLRTISLLNRPPIRKAVSSVALPLTEYADREATRLLSEVAKDRKLLIHLYRDQQAALGELVYAKPSPSWQWSWCRFHRFG